MRDSDTEIMEVKLEIILCIYLHLMYYMNYIFDIPWEKLKTKVLVILLNCVPICTIRLVSSNLFPNSGF